MSAMPRRLAAIALASVLASAAACSSDHGHDMVGSIDATLEGPAGAIALARDPSTTKFRAQIVDDGETCKLEADVDEYRAPKALDLYLNLDSLESAPLVAGGTTTITANDGAPEVNGVKPQIIVNNATVVLKLDGGTYYSIGGTFEIAALPAPKGALSVRFVDVRLRSFEQRTEHVLKGEASFTYIGRNAIRGTTSACPALAPVPGGLVY